MDKIVGFHVVPAMVTVYPQMEAVMVAVEPDSLERNAMSVSY